MVQTEEWYWIQFQKTNGDTFGFNKLKQQGFSKEYVRAQQLQGSCTKKKEKHTQTNLSL